MMFMKKGILLFAVSIILCGSVGAQDSVRTFRNAITVNPLPLMGGGLLMAYEHTLPHAGIEIDAGVQGWQWEKHHDVPMNIHRWMPATGELLSKNAAGLYAAMELVHHLRG